MIITVDHHEVVDHAVDEVWRPTVDLWWPVAGGGLLQVLLRVRPGGDRAQQEVAAGFGEDAVADGVDLRAAGCGQQHRRRRTG